MTRLPKLLAMISVASLPRVADAAPETCRELVTDLVRANFEQRGMTNPPKLQPAKEESLWNKLLQRARPAEPSADVDRIEGSASVMEREGESRGPSPKRSGAAPTGSFNEGVAASEGGAADIGKADHGRAKGIGDKKAKSKDGPSNYSRTNTQEQAVDEGDIVKTDGRTIYHVSCTHAGEASGCRNELRIYSSWPVHDTKLLARYLIPSRGESPAVKQIYLHGDRVIVLLGATIGNGARTQNDAMALAGLGALNIDAQITRVLVLDVSRPKQPELVREVHLEGALVESRMIGSRLYVAASAPGLRLPAELLQETERSFPGLKETNLHQAAKLAVEKLDPKWRHFIDEDPGLPHRREFLANEPSRPIYACADIHTAQTTPGHRLLNVAQLDIAGRDISGAGVAGYQANSIVYASEGAVYVADPTAPVDGRWQTASLIRKFELGRGGKPKFVAQGHVRGNLLNSFAISEHNGNLRVATSDNWASNNLYVLQPQGERLETIGTLENLGRNERIYAVRMMGDRGYIVTFRRTDPLYTLDLSKPSNPEMVGELHIEGFSNYLHPLGKNHLLAIGQDADQFGRPLGFHLQIFDIGDPRRPTRRFHEKLAGGSTSDAQGDHHAFMFEPETNTLSVPWKSDRYWGLIAYRVDPRDGFVNLGRVNHALMYKHWFQRQCERTDDITCGNRNYWYNFVTRAAISVDRVIAIENQLYSLSPSGLMVHRAARRLPLTTSVLVSEPSWGSTPRPVASTW